MKKSLIALAVLGLSGAAMAQSSVTLYGVADAGIAKIKSGGSDSSNKTEFSSHSTMNNGNSRVGLRGVEDLGGGLKAGFQFETGIDLDNGAADGTFWARQANVWLGGNWGTLKLGRQFTPSYLATGVYELTGTANYSAVTNTYNIAGIGFRADSALAYVTPDMGGFSAAVAYVTKTDLSASIAGASKAAYDLALMYNNGPIAAAASANKVGDGKTNYQVGAKYSFSNFALAASYTSSSNASPLVKNSSGNWIPNAAFKAVRRGFSLGGAANFGAFSLALDVTRDTKNESEPGIKGKKYTNGVVEAKYALSKRTFVYGAYLRLDGDNNYGLGIRHNF